MKDEIKWPANMKCAGCNHGLLYHGDFGCDVSDCECERNDRQ